MRLAVVVAFFWTAIFFAGEAVPTNSPSPSNSVASHPVPSFYCPMHCEGSKTYLSPGTCPVCHMYLVKKGDETDENAPLSLRDYRVDLSTDPGELKAGKEIRINLTPRNTKDNSVLRDLEEVHGAEMEVYLTSQELGTMERIRPILLEEGTFSFKQTFQGGGNYLLYVVLTPKGKHTQVFPLALKVAGAKKSIVAPARREAHSSFKDLITMKLPASVQSGQKVPLAFTVTRDEGVAKKRPVLKEFAYVILISRDTTRFIPIHTAVKPISKGKWRLEAELKFPKPGSYVAFLELWNVPETIAFEITAK